jgi:hypothetical protein
MFDIGLYFPKASILSFYLWLIPLSFRRLRVAVFISIAFTTSAFISHCEQLVSLDERDFDWWSCIG